MKKIIILASAIGMLAASCTVTFPIVVTDNAAEKTSVIEKKVFLGLAFGEHDLSITTAAKAKDITKIATVDFKVKKGLFISKYTTIVTGE